MFTYKVTFLFFSLSTVVLMLIILLVQHSSARQILHDSSTPVLSSVGITKTSSDAKESKIIPYPTASQMVPQPYSTPTHFKPSESTEKTSTETLSTEMLAAETTSTEMTSKEMVSTEMSSTKFKPDMASIGKEKGKNLECKFECLEDKQRCF